MTAQTFPSEMLGQHLAIVGKAGSGKTYAAKGLVEGLLRDKRRVCILDPTGVWWGLRSSADGDAPGFPVAVFGGAHADVPIGEQSGAVLAGLLASQNLPAIVDLSEMLIGQRHRFVTDFAESLYRDNRTPLHLVIDEADEFCPQNPMPETKRMLHHVDRIVRRGRVRGFRVMLITQRPAVLHKNVLTQANTLIAMRLTARRIATPSRRGWTVRAMRSRARRC
jgi:DNA helicase HerA-like ATPase